MNNKEISEKKHGAEEFDESMIERPAVDNKAYRYFELHNKLKVLLI